MTTTTLWPADGGWRELAKHAFRQIGLALAAPVIVYFVFGSPVATVLTVTGVGCTVVALLTYGRLSWGKAIAFQASGVHVVRRDGTPLDIPNASLTNVILKPDCFGLVWQQEQKRRSLVVSQESFSPANWTQVMAAARALSESRAAAATPPA